MTEISTLSERGQIVIPQHVREKMHLEAGSKFVVFPLDICQRQKVGYHYFRIAQSSKVYITQATIGW